MVRKQKKKNQKFSEGIRSLGYGVKDGYTREELERTADRLNAGSGLLRNGCFFVNSQGEMCVVLVDPRKQDHRKSADFGRGRP